MSPRTRRRTQGSGTSVGLILLMCLVWVPAATGQATTGSVRGRAAKYAAPVSGATVKLIAPEFGIERVTTSGADGAFSFEEVEPHTYEVRIVAAGFLPGGHQVSVQAGRVAGDTFYLRSVRSRQGADRGCFGVVDEKEKLRWFEQAANSQEDEILVKAFWYVAPYACYYQVLRLSSDGHLYSFRDVPDWAAQGSRSGTLSATEIEELRERLRILDQSTYEAPSEDRANKAVLTLVYRTEKGFTRRDYTGPLPEAARHVTGFLAEALERSGRLPVRVATHPANP